MKKIPVVTETVDVETGEVVNSGLTHFNLLPPKLGLCQDCAVAHVPESPHNAHSMFYQYSFYADHKRWPTWGDAMAHCTPEIQEAWRKSLLERGVKPEQLEPSRG